MPDYEDSDFKFPDESKSKGADEETGIEIEIEDDTPPEDRNKTPMPKPLVEELENDELDDYDEKVKIKLKQMRKVWHDERREKETALRQQNEAINFAKNVIEENKRMKSMLHNGEQEYVNTMQSAAGMELEMAKRAYKEAYEEADSDKMVEAQQAMQIANLKVMQAKNFKLPPLQEVELPVETTQQYPQQQAASAPTPDTKALTWQKRNPWFGQDEEMTASALGLHEKLKRQGVAVGSDEYYATLDKTIRKRFAENFSRPADTPRRPGTVVAPAMRSTSSNKIRLKASQVQLAKKLGLTPEQYAQAALKLEAQNG